MGNFKEYEISGDLSGLSDLLKPSKNASQIITNLSVREKSEGLCLRDGYKLKYTGPTHASISSVTNLSAHNFYVPENGGREITLLIQKGTVNRVTSSGASPASINSILFWIRPYWNGSSWVDAWQWLNEIVLTTILSVNAATISSYDYYNDMELYGQWDTNYFNDFAIINLTKDPDQFTTIVQDKGTALGQEVITGIRSASPWSANDSVLLMRNYMPLTYLQELYNVTEEQISVHKILNDLRIGFGGYENRIAVNVGYRKKYWRLNPGNDTPEIITRPFNDRVTSDRIILDPILPLTDDSAISMIVNTPASGGKSFDAGVHRVKVTCILDLYSEFSLLDQNVTLAANDNIEVILKVIPGIFNKRLTSFRIFISKSITLSYFLAKEVQIYSGDLAGASTDVWTHSEGVSAYTTTITSADFDASSTELDDALGYNHTSVYVKSWDSAKVVGNKVYAVNPYDNERHQNFVFFSPELMYDVITAQNYHSFLGTDLKEIAPLENGNLLALKSDSIEAKDNIYGSSVVLTVLDGAVNKESVQVQGDLIRFCGKYGVHASNGVSVYDLSAGAIYNLYQNIANKSSIKAGIEEKGGAYKILLSDGTEYLLSEKKTPNGLKRDWVKEVRYLTPDQYINTRDGVPWFRKDGNIYYYSGKYDVNSAGANQGIPIVWRSVPIDADLIGEGMRHKDRFYIEEIWINYNSTGDFTFKIYKDGQAAAFQTIAVVKNSSNENKKFKSLTKPGAHFNRVEFEISGTITAGAGDPIFELYGIGFLYKKY